MKRRIDRPSSRYLARARTSPQRKRSIDPQKDLDSLLRNPSLREHLKRLLKLLPA